MTSFPVVLDPGLLTFDRNLTRDEFLARVRFLSEWARLVRSGQVEVQIATEVRNFLIRNGYFPAYEAVAESIESLDLRYRYAPEDVIGPINTILGRASARAYCCVRDEDHDTFLSDPPQPWHRDAAVNEQTQRALLLSMVEGKLHARQDFVFASCLGAEAAKFSARITILDPDSLNGFTPLDLPVAVEAIVPLASDLEGVLALFSSDRLWASAACNSEIKTAIQIRCREILIATGSYNSMADVPEFAVGSDFYPSLVRSQAAGTGRFAGVTREGCASAVMKLPTLEWKPFNVNPRKADGAVPLRAHLTKSGPALRLMAWRLPTGAAIEFSNVGEKWEEEISYTNPADAI